MAWVPPQYDETTDTWIPGYDDGTVDDSTSIDYGYTTVINGTTYSKDKDGNWTYEDSAGNINKADPSDVQKLLNKDTEAAADVAFKDKLNTPGFVDQLNKLFNTNKSINDYLKMGAVGLGGLAGMSSLNQPKVTPTGYQGGIPTLTASQPMLTAPPVGRRPGSGGINYGTGVKYTDPTGKVVSDTSTSIADLLAAANANPFNQPANYGLGTTGTGGISNINPGGVIGGGRNPGTTTGYTQPYQVPSDNIAPTGSTNSSNVSAKMQKDYQSFFDTTKPGSYTDFAGGVLYREPEIQSNTDANGNPVKQYKAVFFAPNGQQYTLDKNSNLNDIAYTIPEIAAAWKNQYGFTATGKAPASGVMTNENWNPIRAAYADEKRPATANYLPQQGLPELAKQSGQVTPTSAGFVTGGGSDSPEAIAKMIAYKKQQDAAEQAKLDAFHIAPNSPFYKYVQDPASIPHLYNESDADALLRVKKNAMEQANMEANRANDTSSVIPGAQLTVASGSLFDANHNVIPPGPNDTNSTVTLADGTSRYVTKAEAAQESKNRQQWMYDQGYQIAPNVPAASQPTASTGGIKTPPALVSVGNGQNNPTPTSTPTSTPNAGLSAAVAQKMQPLEDFAPDENYYGNYGSKAGGLIGHHMAVGGIANLARGRYLQGETDGMADELRTSIDGKEPAALSHGEFVVPADVVSHLGNGNSDAGAKKLYSMMDKIRMARTGTKKQGKEINPDKFMPGGLAKAYAEGGRVKGYAGTTDGSLVSAGVTGTEQNLSNWVGPYATQMMGQAQALANTPYQAYTGPLTAGASDLQNQAFSGAANLAPNGGMATDFAQRAGNVSYTPTTNSFDATQAQTYMNPYLQASLEPQLAEARRASDIMAQQNNAAMTKAGAFGGGRQAILTSENQRNLGSNLANITGQGYNTAYTNAMSQFNADQARKMQENQFGANLGLQGLQTGIGGANTASQIGLNNLNTQANLGNVQRGIESEGIAADKAQFEEARKDPYTKLQFQQSMLNGLPIAAQNYNMSQPSALTQFSQGATSLDKLMKLLGL
jgi:hypothetical protein